MKSFEESEGEGGRERMREKECAREKEREGGGEGREGERREKERKRDSERKRIASRKPTENRRKSGSVTLSTAIVFRLGSAKRQILFAVRNKAGNLRTPARNVEILIRPRERSSGSAE